MAEKSLNEHNLPHKKHWQCWLGITKRMNQLSRFSLVAAEVLFITYLNYKGAGVYYSFDVLYCLPVIHAAQLGAIHATRRSDSRTPVIVAVAIAVFWSATEAFIIWPDYPLGALALNVFTRSVTFTVIGRVITKLWIDKELGRKDVLTNLSNRLEFFERFEIEQVRSERSGKPYSLLFIDIDQFKALNDNQGHHVGDLALKALSGILIENSRRVDTVSRYGGDEFVLLFPETDEKSCELLADRIRTAAEDAFQKQGWPISISIGHATETGNSRSADEILHEADMRMYSFKKSKG
jgi:diguanylate cyclase (GGDEF)-like protein